MLEPKSSRELMLNKVPDITLAFWIIKVMSTTVSETGADYLAKNVGLGTVMTDGIMSFFLAAMLVVQLRTRRYVPWIYWLTVVLVSVVGTQITDALTDGFEISLYASTAAFAIALAATFAIWYASEGDCSRFTASSRTDASCFTGRRLSSPSRWEPLRATWRPRRSV